MASKIDAEWFVLFGRLSGQVERLRLTSRASV